MTFRTGVVLALLAWPLVSAPMTPERLGIPLFPASSLDFGQFLKKAPSTNNPEGLLAMAYTAYQGEKLDEAKGHLALFSDKFQKKSEWAYALVLRGHVLLALGDIAGARSDFYSFNTNKSWKTHPMSLDARIGLAVTSLETDGKGAVTNLLSVVSNFKNKNPYQLTTRVYLGEALRLTGKPKDAVPHFQFALTNAKDFPDVNLFANWRLAQSFEAMGNGNEAMAAYQRIIEDAGARAFELEALSKLAALSEAAGKTEDSSDALKAISARYGQTPQALKARYTLGLRGKAANSKEDVLTWWGGLTGPDFAKEPWRQEVLETLFSMAREAKDGAKISALANQILNEFPGSTAVESVLPELLYGSWRGKQFDAVSDLAKKILSSSKFDAETKRDTARFLIILEEFQKKNLAGAAEAYETWFKLDPPAGLERLTMTRDYVSVLSRLGQKEPLRKGLTMLYESARSVGEKQQAAWQLGQLWADSDPVKAAAFLEECARLRPDGKNAIPALKQRMQLLVKAGKGSDAERAATRFMLIYPEASQAAPMLQETAAALEKAGQKAGALRLWQKLKSEYPKSAQAAQAEDAVKRLN